MKAERQRFFALTVEEIHEEIRKLMFEDGATESNGIYHPGEGRNASDIVNLKRRLKYLGRTRREL